MNNNYKYIVIGAGIAGVTSIRAIRERDRAGSVLLIDGEDRLPYKRTKISKNIAAGFEHNAFALEQAVWYRDNNVDLEYDQRVARIDLEQRRIDLASGKSVEWERLILATGAAPLAPFNDDVSGAHVVRTAAEVEALRGDIVQARSVIVAGGGVLGVEVAEQLRLLDKEVLLIGNRRRLLDRHLDEESSTRLATLLRERGIEVITGLRAELEASTGGEAARIVVPVPDGRREADAIVFCVGVRPNVGLAIDAGLEVGRGVRVNEHMETSAAGVFAAGDVAEQPDGFLSFLWHAAELQGRIAGLNAAGDRAVHDSPPFRLKCEVFGHYFFSISRPQSDAGYEVVRERQGQSYRALYYADDRLRSVVMIDDKERAKAYVSAVREGWRSEEVAERLSFAPVA